MCPRARTCKKRKCESDRSNNHIGHAYGALYQTFVLDNHINTNGQVLDAVQK